MDCAFTKGVYLGERAVQWPMCNSVTGMVWEGLLDCVFTVGIKGRAQCRADV